MRSRLPAAVLSVLLYSQLVFGIAAVATVVWSRSVERHPVVAEASLAAIGAPAIILR